MSEPVLDPAYWRQRLAYASERGHLFQSVYLCNDHMWQQIEARHREILLEKISPEDSVLDAGCGYGRLLTLLPEDWNGYYMGVDISPDFVGMAKRKYPEKRFVVGNLDSLPMDGVGYFKRDGKFSAKFDWAILISIKGMLIGNVGTEFWEKVQHELSRYCSRILLLEYDAKDQGEIIQF